MRETVSVSKQIIVAKQRASYVMAVLTLVMAALAGRYAEDRHAEVVAAEAAKAKVEVERDEALRRLALMIESSPWALIVCSEDGTITNVNGAACKMLGWSHDEMIGKQSGFLIVPPEFREVHQRAIHAAAEKLREYDGDYLLTSNRRAVKALTKDGQELDAIATVRAIKYSGKIEFILSMGPSSPPVEGPLKLQTPEKISDVVQGIMDRNPSLSSLLNQSVDADSKGVIQDSERKD